MAKQEYIRIARMLSNLSASLAISLMTSERIDAIESRVGTEPTLKALHKELTDKLRAVKRPEDHEQMAQAYEAYSEASFWLEMADRGVLLERTPGTGGTGQKRPDFVFRHQQGDIFFEVKALEIADPTSRHKQISHAALEIAADLDQRARKPGVHFGAPLEISGPAPGLSLGGRLDATIDKITNNVKPGQINYGPTILVVDLGRYNTMPYGPSSLLPVFFHDEPPAESCVSGELWQIGYGRIGEQLFCLPEFDGKSNLAGHQQRNGVLREFPALMGITFMCPRWSEPAELLTLWNEGFDKGQLEHACTVDEAALAELLHRFSDGLNDSLNERGWPYRTLQLRPPPGS